MNRREERPLELRSKLLLFKVQNLILKSRKRILILNFSDKQKSISDFHSVPKFRRKRFVVILISDWIDFSAQKANSIVDIVVERQFQKILNFYFVAQKRFNRILRPCCGFNQLMAIQLVQNGSRTAEKIARRVDVEERTHKKRKNDPIKRAQFWSANSEICWKPVGSPERAAEILQLETLFDEHDLAIWVFWKNGSALISPKKRPRQPV